jgi:hypothetical protein
MKLVGRVVILACAALLPVALLAQDTDKPAAPAAKRDSASKWDIFVGYSYLAPNAKIKGTVQGAPGSTYGQINFGGIMSVTRFFNRHLGVQIEGDEHIESEDWPVGSNNYSDNSNDDFAGGSAGVIYRIPMGNITPFVHALVGMEEVGSVYRTDTWGEVGTVGGGLDFRTPFFYRHFSVRLIQGDYQYIEADSTAIRAYRISSGLVYSFGAIAPPPPVTLMCEAGSANGGASVFPGEAVTVASVTGAVQPEMNVLYSWTGTGVTGKGARATVDTAMLAPGSYSVHGLVKEGKPGKEGLKPGESAECVASFTVKAFEPPTISCAAVPGTIKPGESATIQATALSPQSRPLTYTYGATAGTVTGSGNTATFNSAGAPSGAVGITCNVSDDKGQIATANTSVAIMQPYIPPPARTQALCATSFKKDKKRPTRVNNEAKACLDDVALNLRKHPDARAVVVGQSDADEKARQALAERLEAQKRHPQPVEDAAAQRAVNTKDYLVTEQGIDASRVSVATSPTDDQMVENYLVPAGAAFSVDVPGTKMVNEAVAKPHPRKPLPAKKHLKKQVKKAAQ